MFSMLAEIAGTTLLLVGVTTKTPAVRVTLAPFVGTSSGGLALGGSF